MISRDDRPPDDVGLNAEVDAHLMSPVGSDELLDALMLLLEYGEDRSLRVSTDLLVHLRGFFGPEAGGEAMAMAVELTERTMRIEVSDPLARDSSGTARFFLPGESAPVELRAWVLLRLDQPRLHYLLAVEPEEDARVRLARFLSSRRAAPEALRSEGGA
jgi:hypothetical protein